MRPLLLALIGMMLLGFCSVETVTTFIKNPNRAEPLPCDEFSERPTARWVKLEGCTLDFDDALLHDEKGHFERFADRKEGLSRRLYDDPPVWNSLLVPVKTPSNRARPARLLFFLTDRELLAWVNSFERASVEDRAKILRKTMYLDRLATPGVLIGKVERDAEAEATQRAMGLGGAVGLMLLRSAEPPGFELSPFIIGAGLLGSGLLIFAIGRFTGPGRHEPSAAETLTTNEVGGVKLEIGGLEALREEERKRRKERR